MIFPQKEDKIIWFDTQRCGFVWHVVNGWEIKDDDGALKEEEQLCGDKSGKVVLFLNVFDYYPETVPIHVAEEPPSHLWK